MSPTLNPGERGDQARAPRAGALHLLAAMLAWAGVLISMFLIAHQSAILDVICGEGIRCHDVLASRFSKINGVPISWAGLGFHSLTLAVLLAAFGTGHATAVRLLSALRWVVGAAVFVSAGLMYVQSWILRAFCPLCTGSAVVTVALILTLLTLRRSGPRSGDPFLSVSLFVVIFFSTTIVGGILYLPHRDPVIASVDDWHLRESDVRRGVQFAADELAHAEYEAKRDWLEEKITDHLLEEEARRQGLSVSELLRQDLDFSDRAPVEELEKRLAEENRKDPHGAATTWEEARSDLIARKEAIRKKELVERLKAHRDISISLRRPLPTVFSADSRLARTLGPPDAQVKLVVFSDFECSLCAKLAGILAQMHQRFPTQVAIAFRHYPLPFHLHAFRAAEAAECAAEQGKFWEYHDELFRRRPLSETSLSEVAAAVGLDLSRFNACLNSGRGRSLVEASYNDGTDLGIYGTPLLFLNGRKIGGVVEYDELVEMTRAELRESGAVPAR